MRDRFQALVQQRSRYEERLAWVEANPTHPDLNPLSDRMFASYARLRDLTHELAEFAGCSVDELWALVLECAALPRRGERRGGEGG